MLHGPVRIEQSRRFHFHFNVVSNDHEWEHYVDF